MTDNFPQPLEHGNTGNGAPLRLGDPEAIGDLFLPARHPIVLDWDGDGVHELVDSGDGICTWRFDGEIADGTPLVGGGLRWGFMSRSHHHDENDLGLCGKIVTAGDFDGDGRPEIILAPRAYSQAAVVVLKLATGEEGPATGRAAGMPLDIVDASMDDGREGIEKWRGVEMTAFDWDGDGRLDLIAAMCHNEGYSYMDPATDTVPEDQRDRYHKDGRWKGEAATYTLQLLRNTSSATQPQFTYAGSIELSVPIPGGQLAPVDPEDPSAGLLILDDRGNLWHLPMLQSGSTPVWGELAELRTLHGAPFCSVVSLTSIFVASIEAGGRADLFAGTIGSNACWCRYWGRDRNGRPVYDTPHKIKERNPHINGGFFSVPTVGDWRATGTADLVVGSVEGYVFWYKTLSTEPLRFAPPERVRVGDQEIRRWGKPHPAGGYHWGSSQGPGDGFNGGYSNPVLVDWDGDGLLDLIVGDMIGLFDWYPNRGTRTQPDLAPPLRLQVEGEPLFGPWRVQPGVGDFSGDGLPDIVTMDLDLDLVLYRRVGRNDLSLMQRGEKLRFEDGQTIKSTGPYTPQGGDGRGRTKIQLVDWDGNGKLDIVLGVGPQPGSAFKSSYVLICRNIGTNTAPVFKRPEALLFDAAGKPLQFWRHAVHPTLVDWDGDGQWELVVGADLGFVWYYKPEHFGQQMGEYEIYRSTEDTAL
jgi:hypothetical protein